MNLEFSHKNRESAASLISEDESGGDPVQALSKKLQARRAIIGVIGLGYVGLPLALTSTDAGFETIGVDLDESRVGALRAGDSFLSHIDGAAIGKTRGRLQVHSVYAPLSRADVVVICVPTPITSNCAPDLGPIEQATQELSTQLRPGQLVILASTSFPGTTEEIVGAILQQSGLQLGRDFFLAFSPEREDPGSKKFTAQQVPRVVGGTDQDSLELAEAFFGALAIPTVRVSSAQTAEAVKLLENTFRAVNIAFVNELKTVFSSMGIDIWEVIRAAQTKPFGYMPFFPGPGVGGHCIAADPYYLIWRAREFHVSTRLTEMACDINRLMPERVISGLIQALDCASKRGLNGAEILVVGVAYKPNIGDVRDSPALRIIQLLERRGATVSYQDPLVPVLPDFDEYAALAGRTSLPAIGVNYENFDCIIVVTDHDAFDYSRIAESGRLLIDTRNAFERRGISSQKLVKL